MSPDPFTVTQGSRLYRTGDRGRRRPDGTLEWLGRMDGQLKILGNRVEPAEVEAVVTAHPAVHEAAIVGDVRDDGAGTRLLAFVVLAPCGRQDAGAACSARKYASHDTPVASPDKVRNRTERLDNVSSARCWPSANTIAHARPIRPAPMIAAVRSIRRSRGDGHARLPILRWVQLRA